MSRIIAMHHDTDDDGAFDDDLDPLGPSAEDLERFGDTFVMCVSCGKAMYDEASVCPHCGFAAPSVQRVPWWVMIAAVVTLLAMLILLL